MIIDCISDLHGYYPKLEGGDLLIVAGDLTARDTKDEYLVFGYWIEKQRYRKKIVICGNHDGQIQRILQDCKIPEDLDFPPPPINPFAYFGIEYLCDAITEFEGLKIWGSPWTKTFEGMNPHCKAFTVDTEQELAEKCEKIPHDIDILITHSPAYGLLDQNIYGKKCGSIKLLHNLSRIQPMIHIFGHIHESYGKIDEITIKLHPKHKIKRPFISVNASHVNERYEPVNKPIRVIL